MVCYHLSDACLQDALLDVVAGQIFAKADADGDGSISKSEIEEVLTAYSLPFETLDGAFAAIDTDDNGAIDADEFKAFLLEQGVVAVKEKEAKGFFEQFFG